MTNTDNRARERALELLADEEEALGHCLYAGWLREGCPRDDCEAIDKDWDVPETEIRATEKALASPSPQPEGDEVERAARVVFPNEWSSIDRAREIARCYRTTPFAEAGFQSQEAAEERAAEHDAAAERSIAWTTERARAALASLPAREEILEEAAKVADRIRDILGEKPPSGERGTNIVWDTAQRIAEHIRALKSPSPPTMEEGE